MPEIHKTAKGRPIDMTALQLANEHVVAIGNMKVNARGDQLGPGGKIVKTRAEIMAEYHALKGPVADNSEVNTPVDVRPTPTITPDNPEEDTTLKVVKPTKGKKA